MGVNPVWQIVSVSDSLTGHKVVYLIYYEVQNMGHGHGFIE